MRPSARAQRLGMLMLVLLAAAADGSAPAAAQRGRTVQFTVVQDSTIVQDVRLRDGTRLLGRVIAVEGDTVRFTTLGGLELKFPRRDAESVHELHGTRHGDDFWPEDPSGSRLFVAPTARVARAGHGYFGVYELVIPSFGIGVTDFAMISGGFSIVPGIDIGDQAFYVAPKVQLFDAKYVQAAVGAFWVEPGSDVRGAGLAYGAVTAGTHLASFTGGLAVPFTSEYGFEGETFVILGGEIRASRGVKFITENWLAPSEGGGESLMSFGIRIIRHRLTVEAAAITSSDGGFFPLVNFSFSW